MIYCTNCGNKLDKEDKFCSNCGKKITKKLQEEENIDIKNIIDIEDTTEDYDKKDIKENMGIAVLSYLGILAVIPYFMANSSKFAMYHAKQGMNFLIIWCGYAIFYNLLSLIKVKVYSGYWYTDLVTPWYISIFLSILGGCLLALSIIGIVNVCNGKVKELPIIGKIKIIK